MAPATGGGPARPVSPGHPASGRTGERGDEGASHVPAPGSGHSLRRACGGGDRQRMAARLTSVFPAWLVLRGSYSREFWAFPCFSAPAGTIFHSPNANCLAGMMHRLQRSVQERTQ